MIPKEPCNRKTITWPLGLDIITIMALAENGGTQRRYTPIPDHNAGKRVPDVETPMYKAPRHYARVPRANYLPKRGKK